eukprot:GHVU01134771.1.p1 GENE.GHVU01134771.1~~GHVU01134771.1.p1  ORF type:complete len:172 (-),score=22.15 GHVU01134771.1:298-813(-)
MTVSATFTASLSATETGGNSYTDRFTPLVQKVQKLTDGTTANKADILYANERTVTTGANDDIDLAGVLTDAFGSTITAAEVVGLIVINQQQDGTANTTDLTIGGGSNPFLGFLGGTTPTIGPIKPGGCFCLFAGDAAGIGAVTASTADILRIANSSGASATYQIAILARSA